MSNITYVLKCISRTRPISSAKMQFWSMFQLWHNQFTPSTWKGMSLNLGSCPRSGWASRVNFFFFNQSYLSFRKISVLLRDGTVTEREKMKRLKADSKAGYPGSSVRGIESHEAGKRN